MRLYCSSFVPVVCSLLAIVVLHIVFSSTLSQETSQKQIHHRVGLRVRRLGMLGALL